MWLSVLSIMALCQLAGLVLVGGPIAGLQQRHVVSANGVLLSSRYTRVRFRQ
jgi:hypothetical protein